MAKVSHIISRSLLQHWHTASSIEVRWSAERCADTPILRAYGQVRIWADKPENPGEEDEPEPCGTLCILKPYLWSGEDLWHALDGEDGDSLALGEPVLNGQSYRDEFAEWCLEEFGVCPGGDPVLLLDLEVLPQFRGDIQRISTIAVLEALNAFGSADSALVGFAEDAVLSSAVEACREKGLWEWCTPLGAKRWKDVLVTVRPERDAKRR